MARVTSSLFFLLLLLHHVAVEVLGDYRVVVDVRSYDNPTNRCEECGGMSQTCCDAPRNSSCTGPARCDNNFYYCLRELGTEELEVNPLDCNPLVTTETNRNGEAIDFNQSIVLGLPNPLSLEGLALQWEGVQLYIEVQDLDGETATRGNTVDYFLVEIPGSVLPGGGRGGGAELYTGEFGWAEVVLSYKVECVEGYTGEQCDVEDHCFEADCGSGECVNEEDDFSCACPEDFFGEFCETRDHCFGVDCGNGECMNEAESFTCTCAPGYSGQLCQIKSSGNPAAAIGGGVVGVVLFFLLLAAGICVIMVLIRQASKRPHGGQRAIVQPETNYMYIKKQPLAINHGRETAISSSHSSPVKILPARELSDDIENGYAVPDTASMQTRMTVNAAYGVSQEGRRENGNRHASSTREDRTAWLYRTNHWQTPST